MQSNDCDVLILGAGRGPLSPVDMYCAGECGPIPRAPRVANVRIGMTAA
jgi:hypothetical protein